MTARMWEVHEAKQEMKRLQTENERLRGVLQDAAYLAGLARSSSWPGDMAQRVEMAAQRVIRAALSGSNEGG